MTSQFKPTLHTMEERLPPAALSIMTVLKGQMSMMNIGVVLPGGSTPVSAPPSPPTVPPLPPPTVPAPPPLPGGM